MLANHSTNRVRTEAEDSREIRHAISTRVGSGPGTNGDQARPASKPSFQYAVVVVTHGTRLHSLADLLGSLSEDSRLRVYVVDSSGTPSGRVQQGLALDVAEQRLQPRRELMNNGEAVAVVRLGVQNLGQAYSLNVGIQACIKDGAALITLLDDDVSLSDPLPVDRIVEFFFARCNPASDLLILPEVAVRQCNDSGFAVTSGMTLAPALFSRCRFRENFVMDQNDVQFCEDILKLGGKLVHFPDPILNIGPIGKPSGIGLYTLPSWRLYLLVRNCLTLSRERAGLRPGTWRFALYQAMLWTSKSCLAGRNVGGVLLALVYGTADALRSRLGVTQALQRLSGNRFDMPAADDGSRAKDPLRERDRVH